jgi:hypothetical protein
MLQLYQDVLLIKVFGLSNSKLHRRSKEISFEVERVNCYATLIP